MAPRSSELTRPERVPAGSVEDGDGIRVGTGPAVELYIDFLCPFCRRFEEASATELESILAAGLGSLVYHPMAFLDRLSTTRYSSRSAAASGCASDASRFLEYKNALFANQPEEGGPGLSDEELAQLGLALDMDPAFAGCIGEHRYIEWAGFVTRRATERGVTGTPSVFVDGVPVPANGRLITSALEQLEAHA
ncbi:MAG TPA: thioredoxin domain-containing protein [Solirubrobacteraceae bacterium]|jgi:protein-disulfide isomerase|nr:thioredoxin domain-containing protein [Solirubrobacteraceae bacterium]